MICEYCAYEAEVVSSRPKDEHEFLHAQFRIHDLGHDQCTDCDCQHKNVGAWRGE